MNDTPKKGWFQRLSAGLSRSSKQMTDQVVATFVKEPLSEASLEQLEEHLLESDLGPAASARIVERFRALKFGKNAPEREVKEALAEAVAAKIGVTYIPPVFFTGLRFICVLTCLSPWFKPAPGKWGVLIPAVFFMGGLHFALIS